MNEIELLPCPFCESKDVTICWDKENDLKFYGVCCKRCSGNIEIEFLDEDRAINAWNRRSNEIQLNAVKKINLKDGDILVFECETLLTKIELERLKSFVIQGLPNNKAMILDGGIKFKTILSNETSDKKN